MATAAFRPNLGHRGRADGRLIGLIAAGLLLVVLAGAAKKGPVFGVIIALGLVVAWVLLAYPRFSVAFGSIIVMVCEVDPGYGVPLMTHLYDPVFRAFTPATLVMFCGLGAVLIDSVRLNRPLRMPDHVLPMLGLIFAAFVFGAINGEQSGAGFKHYFIGPMEQMIPLVIYPLLIVNVVRDEKDLHKWIVGIGLLAIFKAVAGLFVVFSGLAVPQVDGKPITYFGSTPNLFLVGFLLFGVVAAVSQVKLPWWMWVGLALTVACIILGYRRSMWLGFVAALPFAIVVGSGRTGRRLIVPLLVVTIGLGFAGAKAGAFNGLLGGSFGARIQSINPNKVKTNDQDRYRIAERHNVWREIKQHPLTGIGFGIQWDVTRPLNFTFKDNRDYTHIAALWWWMKSGLLGLVTYIVIVLTGLTLGLRTFMRVKDPLIRAAALGTGACFISLSAVELATTSTGPDERWSVLLGVTFGMLSAALSISGRQSRVTHA